MAPSPILPLSPSHLHLYPRQSIQTVGAAPTTTTATTCPGQYTGGTLAGAILGTFFGTILLLYLFNSLTNKQGRGETVVVEKRKSRRHRSASASSVRRPSRVYSRE